MVEHVVLFKLKAGTTNAQKEAAIQALRGLRNQIDGIVDLTCGENFSERSQGFQIGLVVRFRDRAALDAYLPHPAHRGAVEQYVQPIREDVIVADYEI
jgi:stress responsive alpha/beta barrel protein